jgi:hypothetical protein
MRKNAQRSSPRDLTKECRRRAVLAWAAVYAPLRGDPFRGDPNVIPADWDQRAVDPTPTPRPAELPTVLPTATPPDEDMPPRDPSPPLTATVTPRCPPRRSDRQALASAREFRGGARRGGGRQRGPQQSGRWRGRFPHGTHGDGMGQRRPAPSAPRMARRMQAPGLGHGTGTPCIAPPCVA